MNNTPKRVAILGAGASKDYGLPLVCEYMHKEFLSQYRRLLDQILGEIEPLHSDSSDAATSSVVRRLANPQEWRELRGLSHLNDCLNWMHGNRISMDSHRSYLETGLSVNIEEVYQYILDHEVAESASMVSGAGKRELLFYIWAVTLVYSLKACQKEPVNIEGSTGDHEGDAVGDYNRFWKYLGRTGSIISYNWDFLAASPSMFPSDIGPIPQLVRSFLEEHVGALLIPATEYSEKRIPDDYRKYPKETGLWIPLHGSVAQFGCYHCEQGKNTHSDSLGWLSHMDLKRPAADEYSLHALLVWMTRQRCSYCGQPLLTLMMPPIVDKSPAAHSYFSRMTKLAARELDDADELYIVGFRFSERDLRARNLLKYAVSDNREKRIIVIGSPLRNGEDAKSRAREVEGLYTSILGPSGSTRKYSVESRPMGFREFVKDL